MRGGVRVWIVGEISYLCGRIAGRFSRRTV